MKVCSKCKIEKPLNLFYKEKRSKLGVQSMCKGCFKEWQQSSSGKLAARKAHLAQTYKITLEEYNKLLEEQNYSCAICNTKEEECYKGSGNNLAVDHCHTTGKVRGLLCTSCNILLGNAKDKIEVLEAAIKYLNIMKT